MAVPTASSRASAHLLPISCRGQRRSLPVAPTSAAASAAAAPFASDVSSAAPAVARGGDTRRRSWRAPLVALVSRAARTLIAAFVSASVVVVTRISVVVATITIAPVAVAIVAIIAIVAIVAIAFIAAASSVATPIAAAATCVVDRVVGGSLGRSTTAQRSAVTLA